MGSLAHNSQKEEKNTILKKKKRNQEKHYEICIYLQSSPVVVAACSTDSAVARQARRVRGSNNGQDNGNGNGNSGQGNGGQGNNNGAQGNNDGGQGNNGNDNGPGNNNGKGHGRDRNAIGKVSKGREKLDRKGNSHQRYQVTVDGIPVFGHHEVVHRSKGNGRERVTNDAMPAFLDLIIILAALMSSRQS
jgi:hypothetical protein